jgi:hypothetical protein
MEGRKAVAHELGGYGQKHGGKVIEMQAGSKAADNSQEKAKGDAGEQEEFDHIFLDKIIIDLTLIIN